MSDWLGDVTLPPWYATQHFKDLHDWGVMVKLWRPDEPEPDEKHYGLWKSYTTRGGAEQAARDLNKHHGENISCGYRWRFAGARLISPNGKAD
jgi:hypothetical protein